MKETYDEAKIELIRFNAKDIILTSGEEGSTVEEGSEELDL